MAKEICPLCGEELVGGICADCGGSLNREMNESPITETFKQNTEVHTYQKNSSVSQYTNITGNTTEHNQERNIPVYNNTEITNSGRNVVFTLLSLLMMSSLIGVVVSLLAAFTTKKKLYIVLAVLNVVTFLLRILF